jgi:PAS domain S-box-containing protein
MWVFDVCTLQILEVNDASTRAYGYSKDEFLSKTIKDLRPAEDVELITGILPQLRTNQTHFREFRHQDSQGKVFHVEIMSYPIVFSGRDARLVVTQNIEDKKAIAGELELTQAKLNNMLETTSIGFFQVDHNDQIIYWNRASEMLIGYNRKYLLGKKVWDVFTEAIDTEFYEQYMLAKTERRNVEFTSYFWPVQKWFAVIIYYVEEGLIIHFRDITESKMYEERLLEKIEQLKEISYFNSHYIRKPIASLLGLTGLINNDIITPEEYKKVAFQIHECSLEFDKIVRKINNRVNQEFEHVTYEEIKNFSLNNLVEKVINEEKGLQNSHTIILKNKEEITCYGDEYSIAVALKQLIYNAIKFSPEADIIEVYLDVVSRNAILSVRDFGVGIDSQMLSRIFMGFNKKSVAKDIGPGLAKVSDAALKHNGNVWVESTQGKGAVFTMRLPMSNIGVYKQVGATNFSDYQEPGLEIKYSKSQKYVFVKWSGFHSLHSIKTGCLKLLNSVSEKKAKYILNNNEDVIGTWSEAADWVAAEYFPMLQQTGVTHVAWVYSPSTFSRLSADMTIANIKTAIIVRTFDDVDTAKKWLTEISVTYNPE